MTTYEYRCKVCEADFDQLFRMGKAPSVVECPCCGEEATRRFVNAGMILKGPGDHWPSQQNLRKGQMTKLNEEAGTRMRKTWTPPKLVDQR